MALFEQPSSRPTALFRARYHSTCLNCRDEIDPGDEVGYDEDTVVHADCMVDAPIEKPRGRMPMICSKCFIAHAGECF